MRCVIVGDEPLAGQCMEICLDAGLEVVLVASTHPYVDRLAEERGVPTVDQGDDAFKALDGVEYDALLSIANLRIVPDRLIDRATYAVNFHDGPLPEIAGLNVTSWAILTERREHGVTWHLMTSDVDAGEIVAERRFPIRADETAFSLNARCYEAALDSFPEIASQLADGSLDTRPQADLPGEMYRRRNRPDRVVDPASDDAAAIDRLVRALDFGALSANQIGVPLIVVGEETLVLHSSERVAEPSGESPGTVVSADGQRIRFAAGGGDVDCAVRALDGTPVDAGEVLSRSGLSIGGTLPAPPDGLRAALHRHDGELGGFENAWARRLDSLPTTRLEPDADASSGSVDNGGDWTVVPAEFEATDPAVVAAATALWLARSTGSSAAAFGVIDQRTSEIAADVGGLVTVPVALVTLDDDPSASELVDRARAELDLVARRGPILSSLFGRVPALSDARLPEVVVRIGGDADHSPATGGAFVEVRVGSSSTTVATREGVVDDESLARHLARLAAVVEALDAGHAPARIDVLTSDERELIDRLNATEVDHDRDLTVDDAIWARAASSPDAVAVSSGATSVTYGEITARAERLAARLADSGIGRGGRVGIAVPRGIDMIVGVLATLRLGAAYVPLDPTYPLDRLEYMVEDSGLTALLATDRAADLARRGVTVFDPADDAGATPRTERGGHDPADLAYVIYTSGSTGKPKGVMLEHRNVVNFFVAMDEVIDHDPPGTWLAVTSLSFDISVLELLWTLARGFHVVVKAESGFGTGESASDTGAAVTATTAPTRPVSMSLFYFAAASSERDSGYRLLLEGAKFADQNGFEAVWSPERHFHAFGGSYPNPSVVSAAVAAITDNVHIRAGSVVLPLHSPVRVAEEWSIVDNLSGGRVGISFAPGWQPDDFVLNPSGYAGAREKLPEMIDNVRALWRGESVDLPGHDGQPVSTSTLPRPVQDELPVWLTSAGSPGTFQRAGTLGLNILTHLLGQSVDELAANVERYRTAWREAGHDGEGRVTLMLHTYLDRDVDVAREAAREPMKSYLGTAVGLIKNMASSFPTFAGSGKSDDEAFASLTDDEMDQLLEMAADRYLNTSGLFGSPADAAEVIAKVASVGVDEVACLVDFGVEAQTVIDSFPLLLETKRLVDEMSAEAEAATDAAPAVTATPPAAVVDETVAGLVAVHGVTHFQCTPSLAAMLVANPSDRDALGSVGHVMLGGEALPVELARELRDLLPGRFTNMYGPTETTIWSLVHEITDVDGSSIPIGTPIANNTLRILDDTGHRVPVGVFGELHLGGEGVARGYHDRPELTAERFVDRGDLGRMYATGDVVRIDPEGFVEFAGRSDNQLKIRGHRIELGEIESVLDRHGDVVQSVVVPRGADADPFLVAFVVSKADLDDDALRAHVAEDLPPVMVPSTFVRLDSFPLTPNGKVDRKALPDDVSAVHATDTGDVDAPTDDTEKLVADTWATALGRPVGRDDNFFDVGGHSLLAVRVFRQLGDVVGSGLALTDLFRYPTARTLGAHLRTLDSSDGAAAATGDSTPDDSAGSARGARRRRAMNRRGGN